MLEHDILDLLRPLVDGRAYFDQAPTRVAAPYVVLSQVGGEAFQYVDPSRPSHKHARLQVNVWARDRPSANTLARLIEDAMASSELNCEVNGAMQSLFEPDVSTGYGTRQDFSFWYLD